MQTHTGWYQHHWTRKGSIVWLMRPLQNTRVEKENQDPAGSSAFRWLHLLTMKNIREHWGILKNSDCIWQTSTRANGSGQWLSKTVATTHGTYNTSFRRYWFYTVNISKSSPKTPSWSSRFPITITSPPVPLVLCNPGSHRARCCLRKAEGHFWFYGSHSGSITTLLSREHSVLQSCERNRNKAREHRADL